MPIALLTLSSACASVDELDGEGAEEQAEIGVQEQQLHGLAADKFPSNFVKVCVREAHRQDYLNWVRDGVQNEWQNRANLNIVGWEACTANEPANRIEIHFDHGVFEQTIGSVRHVHLERDFTEINPATGCAWNDWACEGGRPASEYCRNRVPVSYCPRAMGVHEFGHALGFMHEHDSASNQVNYSGSDTASVMAYHSLPVIHNNGGLSEKDKSGVAAAFGASPSYKWTWVGSGSFPGTTTAFQGGWEANGTPQYVCRAPYQGGVHIGKWVNNRCHIAWGAGEAQIFGNAELLYGPGVTWGGSGANVMGGMESNGTSLIGACRASLNGGKHVGKLTHGTCWISYGGSAIQASSYEILKRN